MTKKKNKKVKKDGAVLVFSLIVILVILTMALGAAQISLTNIKEASSTDKSVSAFQAADSGAEVTLLNLWDATNDSDQISNYFTCDGVTNRIATVDANGKTSYVTFYDDTLPTPDQLDCDAIVDDVYSIKSAGEQDSFSRNLNVKVKPVVRFAPLENIGMVGNDISDGVFTRKMIIDDIDNDGVEDIVVGSRSGTTRGLWWFDGHNSWNKTNIQNVHDVETFRIFDFDNDGWKDVVAIDTYAVAPSVSENQFIVRNDSAVFDSPEVIGSADYVQTYIGMDYFDFEGDGDLDFIMAGGPANAALGTRGMDLYINDGSGIFTRSAICPSASCVAGYIATSIKVADLDDDGDLDVVAGYFGGRVFWLENNGVSFVYHSISFAATNWVDVVDIDGDGDLDIIGSSVNAASASGGIRVYKNNGAVVPSFASSLISSLGFSGNKLADLDDDGDLDIVNLRSGVDISWLRNRGNGTFSPMKNIDTFPATGDNVWEVDFDLSDFDDDGDLDIAVMYGPVSGSFGGVGIYKNELFP